METLKIGAVVEVDRRLYRHCGLFYGWRGDVPMVLANLPGGTCIQARDEFSGGRPVKGLGYPRGMSPQQVIARAQGVMNRPYSWLSWNCEHFVTYAHGLKVGSPQVLGWATVVGLLGLVITASRA